MTEQTCDRCDKPMDPEDERECEKCCEVLCSRCMYDDTLCNDCGCIAAEEEGLWNYRQTTVSTF